MNDHKKNSFVTLGLIQSKIYKNQERNLQEAGKAVEAAAKKGAQIICLPELYNSIYFPQYRDADRDKFVETIPGKSTALFSKIAKKNKVVIIAPIFEKTKKNKYYNSAVVINADGRIMDVYRKIHIPHDPSFYEKNYFDEGQGEYHVYKTRYANFAVLICYDQWFPEAARIVTLMGADLIFYPTAIGYIKGQKNRDGNWADAWETVMRGHAIANGTHVAAVNRVGIEDRLKFWGSSFVCDSFGKILKKASNKSPEIIICKIDLEYNRFIKEGWGFLKNRRPETYQELIKKRS